MNKLLVLLVAAIAFYLVLERDIGSAGSSIERQPGGAEQVAQAFRNRQSDLQLGGSGVVVKVLPDDTKGSRHQKFILELASGDTLLVAHNIDLAPRIEALREGDTIEFYGEYEWNARGGVLHWTHHDPGGRHEDGWLKRGDKLYQ